MMHAGRMGEWVVVAVLASVVGLYKRSAVDGGSHVVLTVARGGCRDARSWRLVAVLLAFASAGCAGLPPQDVGPEPLDRFERVNRGIYRFNRGFDRAVARPVARAYDRVVPPVVERRFRNFFTNLRAPTDITNNWLQGKFKPGFADLGRFLLNTVAGGGFWIPRRSSDWNGMPKISARRWPSGACRRAAIS